MWMMGASLNSSSTAAKEMDMVLKSEIASHSAYSEKSSYHGVPLPGKKKVCAPSILRLGRLFFQSQKNYFNFLILYFWLFWLQRSSSSATSQGSGEGTSAGANKSSSQPQTLEELLERQWEQGSQFLMEQASHFDSKQILFTIWNFFSCYQK